MAQATLKVIQPKLKGEVIKKKESTVSLVTGDLLVTLLWVALSSIFSEIALWLGSYFKVGRVALELSVTISALFLIGPLCNLFGGAIFNPVHNAACLICGKGGRTVNILRMVGQLVGALLGSLAAVTLIPPSLQGKFQSLPGGLKNGTALELGFLCEAGLSFIMNIAFLYSSDFPTSKVNNLILILNPTLNTLIGMHFTGPSLNPFVAFSWYWHFQGHPAQEHVILYWAAPFAGAVAAGVAWRRWGKKTAAAKESKKEL